MFVLFSWGICITISVWLTLTKSYVCLCVMSIWCSGMQLYAMWFVVDRIRLSEPQSPGTAWFLDQLIAASTIVKLLFDLLTDSSIVSSGIS